MARKPRIQTLTPAQSLNEAAGEIAELHGRIGTNLRRTLDDAIRIGELLCQAKELCDHGAWEKWCRRQLPFGMTTLKWYIRIFQGRDQIVTGDDLSIRDAKRLLSPPKAETPAPAEQKSEYTPPHEKPNADLPESPPAAGQASGPASQATTVQAGGPEEYPLPRTDAKLWICRDATEPKPFSNALRLFPQEPKFTAGSWILGGPCTVLPEKLFTEIAPGQIATCKLTIQLLSPPEDRQKEPVYKF